MNSLQRCSKEKQHLAFAKSDPVMVLM